MTESDQNHRQTLEDAIAKVRRQIEVEMTPQQVHLKFGGDEERQNLVAALRIELAELETALDTLDTEAAARAADSEAAASALEADPLLLGDPTQARRMGLTLGQRERLAIFLIVLALIAAGPFIRYGHGIHWPAR